MVSRCNKIDFDRLCPSKGVVLSAAERRCCQTKLYETSMKLLNGFSLEMFSIRKLHIIVNSIESAAYKTSLTKEEYQQNIILKFNIFRAKILQQMKNTKQCNALQTVDSSLSFDENPPTTQRKDLMADQMESIKLRNLQKYKGPLNGLIVKCKKQMAAPNISESKKKYFQDSFVQLERIQSILDGKEFLVPPESSRYEVLLKMESQLSSLASALATKPIEIESSNFVEIEDAREGVEQSKAKLHSLSLSLFLKKIQLEKFKDIFEENCITSLEDIQALSDEDLRELQIPVGARNRIRRYFLQIKEALEQNFEENQEEETFQGQIHAVGEGGQIRAMKEHFCKQMWEHFKCPITQDLMRDPVISCDGYTYEREAIVQWLKISQKSPLSGLLLENNSLLPNYNLRSQVAHFCALLEQSPIEVDM